MKTINFFEKKSYKVSKLFPSTNFKNNNIINNVKTLAAADKNDLTFFDSPKYKSQAKKTKSKYCLTYQNLANLLPNDTEKIIVKNVLYELAKALKKIYPFADVDYPDISAKAPSKKKFPSVKFCNNVLVGKNVKIGKNTFIGANSIIEKSVVIGKNCVVGSNVVIKNTILGDNVVIQDSCKIGQKGFGFIPIYNNNFKIPHIGKVIIEDNVELASACTIDRGSVDDTVIGKNTYLDNQIHIAHNVKIGENSIIAGQVGIAGSSVIGSNVKIGGQAGISGHLKIGNNVEIGGGSGVIRDIPDNTKVMGYPAKNIREFLRDNK